MPRKTDSSNPADWLFIAESDLEGLQHLAEAGIAYAMCQSKLAEVLEKIVKAELIRLGWFLEKTHELPRLAGAPHPARTGEPTAAPSPEEAAAGDLRLERGRKPEPSGCQRTGAGMRRP